MNYSEKTIQNKIIKDLKDRGYWVMKTQGGVAGTPIGTPDIIACDISGCFVGIEVKKIGGHISQEQLHQLGKISQHSLDVYVTNDPDFGKKIADFFHDSDEIKVTNFTKTITYWMFKRRFYEVIHD